MVGKFKTQQTVSCISADNLEVGRKKSIPLRNITLLNTSEKYYRIMTIQFSHNLKNQDFFLLKEKNCLLIF